MTLLCGEMPVAPGPLVAVVCAEGDTHSLPARVVAGVLTLRGFHSLLLGASLAPAVAVHPECLVIDQHRPALIASAVPPDEAQAGTGLADEVSRLLDVVQGALLLDAPALLTEELASASAIRAGNGAGAGALTRVLGRLVTATGAALPATTALLLAA